MLEPITYKKVLNEDGSLKSIELWQDDRYIEITLGSGSHRAGFRWEEVKGVVDNLAESALREINDALNIDPITKHLMKLNEEKANESN